MDDAGSARGRGRGGGVNLRLDGLLTQSYVLLTKLLTRYWGYLAVIIAVAGFVLHNIGLTVILALSLAALGYFLLQAPVWCGAETRTGEPCRETRPQVETARTGLWSRWPQSPPAGRSGSSMSTRNRPWWPMWASSRHHRPGASRADQACGVKVVQPRGAPP